MDDDEEPEEDLLGFYGALFWLLILTVLIAVLSEALVGTIEEATSSSGISNVFVSTIIIPIIGNAAEHASAIIFCAKNKVDLGLSIAIGSSTQIAIFVIPILVLIGWFTDKPLDLYFQPYETCTVFLAVISVAFAIQNGKSNWLIGFTLVGAYVIVSIGFWVHVNEVL